MVLRALNKPWLKLETCARPTRHLGRGAALSTLREAIAGLKADVDRWQAAVTDAARVEAEAKTDSIQLGALYSHVGRREKGGYGPEHIDPAASLRQRVDAQERHVDTLRAQVERQRTALSEAERKHADLVSQKTQAVPRLERLVKSQDAATQALQAVLVTLELDSVSALQAMRLEPSTLVSLRARQDAISTRLTESSSSVKTCQEALDAHQTRRPQSLPDDASADTVRAQLNSAEAALQAAAESERLTGSLRSIATR